MADLPRGLDTIVLPGPRGASLIPGVVSPTLAVGKEGDAYWNISNGDVFLKSDIGWEFLQRFEAASIIQIVEATTAATNALALSLQHKNSAAASAEDAQLAAADAIAAAADIIAAGGETVPGLSLQIAAKQDGYSALRIPTKHDFIERPPSNMRNADLDLNGRVLSYFDETGGEHTFKGSTGTSYSAAQLAEINAEADQRTRAYQNQALPIKVQQVSKTGFSIIGLAGQSLAAGAQMIGDAGPMTALATILMYGQSSRPDETNTKRGGRSTGGAHFRGRVNGGALDVIEVLEVEGNYRVAVGGTLVGTGITSSPPTTITSQISGTPFGVGFYQLSQAMAAPVSANWTILRDTRDDRLLPARPGIRYSEALENVLNGNISLGSPPYSDNPANANWRRLVGYERANLGLTVDYYTAQYFKRERNKKGNRPDSWPYERLIIADWAVGATGSAEWKRLTAADNYGPGPYVRGNRVRLPDHLYGAATLTAGSSTGNPPPAMGEGASNAFWAISTDCFNRIEEGLAALKNAANLEDPGKAVALLAMLFLQGTNDSPRGSDYLTNMQAVIAALRVVEKQIFGDYQTDPSAFLIYCEQVNQAGFTLTNTIWTSGATFALGAVTDSGGFYWMSLQNGNTGNTPAIGSSWWVRLVDRAIWRSVEVYSAYDWTTVGDRAFYSKANFNLNHPPLIDGSVNADWWAEFTGSWSPAGILVDDKKLELFQSDPTVFHLGSGYAAWHKRRVHGSANWPKQVAIWANRVLQHVISDGKRWKPLLPERGRTKANEFVIEFHVPRGGLQTKPFFRDINSQITLPHWGIRVFDDVAKRPKNGVPDGVTPIYLPSAGLAASDYTLKIEGSHIVRGIANRDLVGDVTLTFGDPAGSYSATNLCDGAGYGAADSYAYSASQDGFTTNDMHPLEANQQDEPFMENNWCIARSLVCSRD